MLVRTHKSVRDGKKSKIIDEFAIDGVTIQKLLDTLKQAAIEAGEWSEKQDVTLRPAAEPGAVDYSKMPLETLLAARQKMIEAQQMLTVEASVEAVGGNVVVVAGEAPAPAAGSAQALFTIS